MRDVTPNAHSRNQKVDLRELFRYLAEFVKHPKNRIAQLPDWNWPTLFTFQVILSICSGTIAGLIKLNIYRVAAGLILMPIVSTLAALGLALALYYYFQFVENRTESYRKIFTLVIFSSIPFNLFQILSEYFAPVTLIGFTFTALLALIGLRSNFQVTQNRAYQLIGGLYGLVLLAWVINWQTIPA
ncbi:MAG: YIP1 family protein [Bdellovibrionaceae bacterium]|nr:YIP1 family protein [Bdellovibrio sp.]